MKSWSFEARIARAGELAKIHSAARDLLTFYHTLLLFQKPIYEELGSADQTGLDALLRHFPALFDLVEHAGPRLLADFGREHLSTPSAREEVLLASWEGHASSDGGRFYARALLQPYAEHLASRRDNLASEIASPTCPFCSARPVVGVLRGEGEGAKRSLLCSLCSTEWLFRRVVCPNCGCEEKDSLPAYTASDFADVRIEACDVCHTYIKSVDLTKNGRAVPVVDEMATVALSVWAEDRGYAKVETNLLGL
jgi:FdhE protein